MRILIVAGAIALLALPATVSIAAATPAKSSVTEFAAAAKKKTVKKTAKPKVEYMRAVPWK